jgi:hypothetical protein
MGKHTSGTIHHVARLVVFFSLSLVLALEGVAQPRPVRFIEAESPLLWRALWAADGRVDTLGRFGVPGDHVALGRWLGTGAEQLGVVSADTERGALVWKVLTPSGGVTEQLLGAVGDTVIAAADFDATGIDDPTVVSAAGRTLQWSIAIDRFRGGFRTLTFQLGSRGEAPFYINYDGSGPWLATFGGNGRASTVRLLNPRTGARVQVRGLPALPSSAPAQPMALRNAEGRELLLVAQRVGGRTQLTVFDLINRTTVGVTVAGSGAVVVGDFLDGAGDEYALLGAAGVVVGDPWSGEQRVVSAPSANPILIDGVNINRVTAGDPPAPSTPTPRPTTAAPAATPRPPVNGGSGGGSPPESLGRVCAAHSPIAPGELLIKSEPSSHIHGGDPRTTGYTVVCARICPSNLSYAQIFYSDGSFAGAVAKYGVFRGNRKPRLYGAVGRAPQHFAAQVATQASRIGNGKLYLQMSSATTGVGTWCKEFLPVGRNGSL